MNTQRSPESLKMGLVIDSHFGWAYESSKNQAVKPTFLLSFMLTMMSIVVATAAGDSPITVSIAIPNNRHNERQLDYNTDKLFHVIVTNTSDEPIRIWREWCSWGYYGLSFEFTDATGKKWKAEKGLTAWTKNYPDFWSLEAHESLVLDVQFAKTNIWVGFPHLQQPSQTFIMRAVFEFQPDDESHKYSIWTGKVASEAKTYVFYK